MKEEERPRERLCDVDRKGNGMIEWQKMEIKSDKVDENIQKSGNEKGDCLITLIRKGRRMTQNRKEEHLRPSDTRKLIEKYFMSLVHEC